MNSSFKVREGAPSLALGVLIRLDGQVSDLEKYQENFVRGSGRGYGGGVIVDLSHLLTRRINDSTPNCGLSHLLMQMVLTRSLSLWY